jgi:hypothetical protein
MVRLGWLLVWTGCLSWQKPADMPPLVGEVRIADGQLVVASCGLDEHTEVTILPARRSIEVDTSTTYRLGGCTYHRTAFPSDTLAPPGCGDAVQSWQTAIAGRWSAQARQRVWDAMPRACRAFVEEASR